MTTDAFIQAFDRMDDFISVNRDCTRKQAGKAYGCLLESLEISSRTARLVSQLVAERLPDDDHRTCVVFGVVLGVLAAQCEAELRDVAVRAA